MNLLKLCEGDTAALIALSSSETELSDLFSYLSRLNEILFRLEEDILQPLHSFTNIAADSEQNKATVPIINPRIVHTDGRNNPLDSNYQFRCLSRSIDHFISNCTKTQAIISELNWKQLCSLVLLFASKNDTGIIPAISDLFNQILAIIINTYIIITNMKQSSVIFVDDTGKGDSDRYLSDTFVSVTKDLDEIYRYFCTLIPHDEMRSQSISALSP